MTQFSMYESHFNDLFLVVITTPAYLDVISNEVRLIAYLKLRLVDVVLVVITTLYLWKPLVVNFNTSSNLLRFK